MVKTFYTFCPHLQPFEYLFRSHFSTWGWDTFFFSDTLGERQEERLWVPNGESKQSPIEGGRWRRITHGTLPPTLIPMRCTNVIRSLAYFGFRKFYPDTTESFSPSVCPQFSHWHSTQSQIGFLRSRNKILCVSNVSFFSHRHLPDIKFILLASTFSSHPHPTHRALWARKQGSSTIFIYHSFLSSIPLWVVQWIYSQQLQHHKTRQTLWGWP